jgi:hypothetical protein
MRTIAVDWSGAVHGAERHIWLAEAAEPGRLVRLEAGRDRPAITAELLTVRGEAVIGLDFAFGVPAWFAHELGAANAAALWQAVAAHGEAWLAACEPPFWGWPRRPRPVLGDRAWRQTERHVPRTAGVAPKSVFQIRGPGSVGTGSIRGMPLLRTLQAGGASIWPADPPGWPRVIEIYPRLLTGPVHKADPVARRALLDRRFPALEAAHRQAAIASEDAFDAAVSALAMLEWAADLASLPHETDPLVRLEGRIWYPHWRAELHT